MKIWGFSPNNAGLGFFVGIFSPHSSPPIFLFIYLALGCNYLMELFYLSKSQSSSKHCYCFYEKTKIKQIFRIVV